MAAAKKLKVGVVGVGRMGAFHVEKYAALPQVELVGVADINADRAAEVAAKFSIPAFNDYRDLLRRVQAVTVAVPTTLHFDVALQSLEAGVHVLVEKPMAASLDQIDKLLELAKARGLILMPGHVERFNAALDAVKKVIVNPRFIEAHRLNIFTPRGTDVDVILDLMIHDLDIVLNLVSRPVEEIFSVGVPVLSPNVDIANARLHFGDRCVANLTASRVSREVLRKIRIFQPNTYISIDYAGLKVEMVHRRMEDGTPTLSGETLDLEKGDALLQEVRAFVSSVLTGAAPPVTVEHAREVMRVALSILDNMILIEPDSAGGDE